MDNNIKAKNLLRRAKSNLIRGEENSYLDLKEIALEDLCFDLRQSVEKSLKAVLTCNNIDYPYTHKLNILIDLLAENSIPITDRVRDSAILNTFAVEARYDDMIQLSQDIYIDALEIAKAVYEWAANQIEIKNN